MKCRFGNVRLRSDGCLYGVPRKSYTRKTPYPQHTIRVKVLPREKASIIMLRRHGYPINMISKFLGRSTSFIHRTLRTAILRFTLHNVDMRKLPTKIRLSTSTKRWINFKKYWRRWESFIFGESEEPP